MPEELEASVHTCTYCLRVFSLGLNLLLKSKVYSEKYILNVAIFPIFYRVIYSLGVFIVFGALLL